MVSPDFVTQTKTKTNPSSILHPFPPTLQERQQPAQAVKIPSLFTAPVPKDRLSSQFPTNLLPKKRPHPLWVSHFHRAPQGVPGCFCPEILLLCSGLSTCKEVAWGILGQIFVTSPPTRCRVGSLTLLHCMMSKLFFFFFLFNLKIKIKKSSVFTFQEFLILLPRLCMLYWTGEPFSFTEAD